MHDSCISWFFLFKNHFWQKLSFYCWDKFDYPGSIIYLSCYNLLVFTIWTGFRLKNTIRNCQFNGKWHQKFSAISIHNFWPCTKFYWLTFEKDSKALVAPGSCHVASSRQELSENEWFSIFFRAYLKEFSILDPRPLVGKGPIKSLP